MKQLFYVLSFLVVMLMASCTDGSHREFNHLLIELAGQDEEISGQDWKKIQNYLQSNQDHFEDFFEDGHLKVSEVEAYITDFFAKRRPPKHIRFVGINGEALKFHIFVERSGSMTAYDSPNGDGSFRSAIMAMENSISGKVRVDSIGDKGYTDYRKIFDEMLNRTQGDEVSILVTDMIYSVKDMEGVNPQKVFNEAQEMVRSVFKDAVKDKAMLVVRMNGSYNGPYYSYDNSVKTFNGRRPYYIIVITSNSNMEQLTTDPDYRTFADFRSLKGYENMCLFTASPIYSPYCSFLLGGKGLAGHFRPARGQEDAVTRLTDVEPDKDKGYVQLTLAVDLKGMLTDADYLTDIRHYQLISDDGIKLKAIRPITASDRTPAEKKYLGTATHLFVLTVPKVTHEQSLKIRLLNQLPAWTQQGSTDNDLVPDNATTFGLNPLLQGIYGSYNRNAGDTPAYFELNLNIDN